MKFQLCVLAGLLAVGSSGFAETKGQGGIWCPALLQGEAFIPDGIQLNNGTLTKYYDNIGKSELSDKSDQFEEPFKLSSVNNLTTTDQFQNIVTAGFFDDEDESAANNLHPKYDLNKVFETDGAAITSKMGLSVDQLKKVTSVQQLNFDGLFSGDYGRRSVTVYRLYQGKTLIATLGEGAFENSPSPCSSTPGGPKAAAQNTPAPKRQGDGNLPEQGLTGQ